MRESSKMSARRPFTNRRTNPSVTRHYSIGYLLEVFAGQAPVPPGMFLDEEDASLDITTTIPHDDDDSEEKQEPRTIIPIFNQTPLPSSRLSILFSTPVQRRRPPPPSTPAPRSISMMRSESEASRPSTATTTTTTSTSSKNPKDPKPRPYYPGTKIPPERMGRELYIPRSQRLANASEIGSKASTTMKRKGPLRPWQTATVTAVQKSQGLLGPGPRPISAATSTSFRFETEAKAPTTTESKGNKGTRPWLSATAVRKPRGLLGPRPFSSTSTCSGGFMISSPIPTRPFSCSSLNEEFVQMNVNQSGAFCIQGDEEDIFQNNHHHQQEMLFGNGDAETWNQTFVIDQKDEKEESSHPQPTIFDMGGSRGRSGLSTIQDIQRFRRTEPPKFPYNHYY